MLLLPFLCTARGYHQGSGTIWVGFVLFFFFYVGHFLRITIMYRSYGELNGSICVDSLRWQSNTDKHTSTECPGSDDVVDY